MIGVKRARCPAKPAVSCLYLADYDIKTGRDALILDVENFPATITLVYKPTKQPTSEKKLTTQPNFHQPPTRGKCRTTQAWGLQGAVRSW